MKRLLFAFVLLVATSCIGGGSLKSSTKEQTKSDVVEILYFHGKQRCITCRAIETLTMEVLDENFAQELEDGTLELKIIDISTAEGEAIADQYEVTWSSLYINEWRDNKESRNNFTEIGFAKAKNMPDEFKAEVKAKLDSLLK